MNAKIFIGNLPMSVTEDSLKDMFSRFGNIDHVSIKQPKHPPAFGFIEFQNQEDAESACRDMNGHEVDGAVLRVEISRGRREPMERGDRRQRRGFRVRVSNLPRNVSWQDLKDIMREYGQVMFTEVDRQGGGVAEFSSRRDMDYCIDRLDDTSISGNYVRVEPEGGRRRSRSPPRRRRGRSRSSGRRGSRRGGGRSRSRSSGRGRRPASRDRDRRDRSRDREDERRGGDDRRGGAEERRDGGERRDEEDRRDDRGRDEN